MFQLDLTRNAAFIVDARNALNVSRARDTWTPSSTVPIGVKLILFVRAKKYPPSFALIGNATLT